MRVKAIRRVKLWTPTPTYQVINASPNHNYLVRAKSVCICSKNSGILDEVDFYQGANTRFEKSNIMNIYRAVKRRMESRYMKLGKLPGILFLISSKKSELDFLEQYISRVKYKPYVLVVDQPLWKVKPGNYSGKTFQVAIGGKYASSKIIAPGEDPRKYEALGYTILDVPIEHKGAFELDINSALADIAGVSSAAVTRFIPGDQYRKCVDSTRPNPFRVETIVTGIYQSDLLQEYLDLNLLDGKRSEPHFIHIDPSKTGDCTGICMVSISGTADVDRLDRTQVRKTRDLTYTQKLCVQIKAAPGDEIPYNKIREFIYWLKNELGYNILKVTADGYQSADMLQQLRLRGYETEVISMDKTPIPYGVFRQTVMETRVRLLPHSIQETEVVSLQQDNLTKKIDHPEGGSKDLADALAGSIYSASTYKGAASLLYKTDDILAVAGELPELTSKDQDLVGDWVLSDYDYEKPLHKKDVIEDLNELGRRSRKLRGIVDW